MNMAIDESHHGKSSRRIAWASRFLFGTCCNTPYRIDPLVLCYLTSPNCIGRRVSCYALTATAAFVVWVCRWSTLRRFSVTGISAGRFTGFAQICSIRSTIARL